MRKAEMVQRIAQEIGCTTARAEAAVEAILTTIKASLQQGEREHQKPGEVECVCTGGDIAHTPYFLRKESTSPDFLMLSFNTPP
jgi:hypothetical protein